MIRGITPLSLHCIWKPSLKSHPSLHQDPTIAANCRKKQKSAESFYKSNGPTNQHAIKLGPRVKKFAVKESDSVLRLQRRR
uniref:Uncharacterized protein n=1 Tax=Pyxicephalus adspersus TaxID=30357 RepID=A0AAV3AK26_PYXAD|nr:TPA: hypothetical protein GDO54_008189 [Pyxicephalus adspersus]